MANTFYTPEQVAAVGVQLVTADMVLAATVGRTFEADFGGGKGTTVNVRIPASLTARQRNIGATTAITTDNISESVIPVTITDMVYSAVDVTDDDLSLNLEDFGRQVLAPQTLAVAEWIEDKVVDEMQSVPATADLSYDPSNPLKVFYDAREMLRDLQVPVSNLRAAIGTAVTSDVLQSDKLLDASKSGSTAALREATVGRIAGFDLIESNRLGKDEIVFYHRDAFHLAIRAPRVPEGVTFGQSVASNGFAMRYIRDYDSSVLQDRSIVSTYVGTGTMPLKQSQGGQVTPALRVAPTAS